MNAVDGHYCSPAWLPGGHAQTIYPTLIRRPQVAYRRQRRDSPDGDFIDFDWVDPAAGTAATPLVVLFHGLESSSAAHYALALMTHLLATGWRGVVPHFRGCSGEPNRLPRAYHSGDYSEVAWMLSTIRKQLPAAPLFAAGVSLGGSALLNWLGREEQRPRSLRYGRHRATARLCRRRGLLDARKQQAVAQGGRGAHPGAQCAQ